MIIPAKKILSLIIVFDLKFVSFHLSVALSQGIIQAIPKRKAEDLVQVIRSRIYGYHTSNNEIHGPTHKKPDNSTSVADELTKFAKLKEQGVLTPEEFERIKKDLLEGTK